MTYLYRARGITISGSATEDQNFFLLLLSLNEDLGGIFYHRVQLLSKTLEIELFITL